MTKNDDRKNNLTQLQKKAVIAIVENKTARDAAKACGAAESTIYKYMQDPVIMAEVRAYEKQIRDTVGYRLASGSNEMLDIIEGVAKGKIIDTDNVRASVRLRAAIAWLDNLYRTQDMTEIELRLTALEAAHEQNN
jgi:hypothetical protein